LIKKYKNLNFHHQLSSFQFGSGPGDSKSSSSQIRLPSAKTPFIISISDICSVLKNVLY